MKRASEQLKLDVFTGDPLEAAPNAIEPARQALVDHGIPVTDRNVFLVLAAMVPGKKMEVNEGIRLLTGTAKIDVPLKKQGDATPAASPAAPATGPTTMRCSVQEGGTTRTFVVTLEPVGGEAAAGAAAPATGAADSTTGSPVFSTFAGAVEIVDLKVKVGDHVTAGRVVAQVEAMKATHDIKSPIEGTVTGVFVRIGQEIDSTTPILTIG